MKARMNLRELTPETYRRMAALGNASGRGIEAPAGAGAEAGVR